MNRQFCTNNLKISSERKTAGDRPNCRIIFRTSRAVLLQKHCTFFGFLSTVQDQLLALAPKNLHIKGKIVDIAGFLYIEIML